MKIQRATPASFKLTDLANAGVEMRLMIATIKPVLKNLNPFSIFYSPFKLASQLLHFVCQR